MMVMGTTATARQFDEEYAAAADTAVQKLLDVLPASKQEELAAVRDSFTFGDSIPEALRDRLATLRRAIMDCRQITIRYRTGRTNATTRAVNPYQLLHIDQAWVLFGYCHLRQDCRYFRINRIDHLTVNAAQFARPAVHNLFQRERDDRHHWATVLVAPDAVNRSREDPPFYQTSSEETPDGDLLTLALRSDSDLMPWLLSCGASARVLSPQSLIDLHRRVSQQMFEMYDAVAIPVSQRPVILNED